MKLQKLKKHIGELNDLREEILLENNSCNSYYQDILIVREFLEVAYPLNRNILQNILVNSMEEFMNNYNSSSVDDEIILTLLDRAIEVLESVETFQD